MLAAHMDEIGFLVKHIDDRGFYPLQPVGGFDARVLVAQRVYVHGFKGETLLVPSNPAPNQPTFSPMKSVANPSNWTICLWMSVCLARK
jgi:endoglucanase